MLSHPAIGARAWLLRGLLSLVCVLLWAGIASAEWDHTIVRVEEDWELVIATPDPESTGPQVICTTSPQSWVGGLYCALELNHQTVPDFAPGGLQFQLWNGEALLVDRRAPMQGVLAHPGEVIRWTQTMELNDGILTVEVIDGSSTTWGSFGGQGYLKASVCTSLESLNGYRPSASVTNSGIGYAANRVQSFILKRVRVTTASGEVDIGITTLRK